ncbi:protein dispatched [Teleopsis dalmanni]|uniref:protein dispatched n=1 Tax=Teleopsis dalmanni TaxID=139649 RepID=UPI0018CEDA02|nr:protein dispatched [Teleopsis dalmanni]
MHWYYNLLVRRPYLMVIAIAVLCVACIIVSLTSNSLPDFTDPTLGFEARGTNLGKRLIAWNNLIKENELVSNPNDLPYYQDNWYDHISNSHHKKHKHRNHKNCKQKKRRKQKIHKKKNNNGMNGKDNIHNSLQYVNQVDTTYNNENSSQWNVNNGIFRDYEITNETWSSMEMLNRSEHFEYGKNTTFVDEDYHRQRIQTEKITWQNLKQASLSRSKSDGIHMAAGYFCDSPGNMYAHFVVERIGPNATDSLFDLNALFGMCELQEQITSVTDYSDYCEIERDTNNCCRPWSLPNYAALSVNKSSCFDLTNEDVVMLKNLLVVCFDYYDLKLNNDCNEYNSCPAECTPTVYEILHYLTDHNFIKANDSAIFLKYAMIFVPVVETTRTLNLFKEWEVANMKNDIVHVVAMDSGLENEIFNERLLTDTWLVALGAVFVTTCIWLYTTSIFVTVMICLAVLFSLGLAYFMYTIVLEMPFFPYMNLLAVVVIIGIGADNAFIYIKIWQCVLAERFTKSTITAHSLSTVEVEYTETLQNLIALTLRHSAPSMLVTSLTTSGAFFAAYTSSITAIKCFGVFAGTVVVANYILMVTWLPASVSIMERMSGLSTCSKLQVQKLFLLFNKSLSKFCNAFEKYITEAVTNYAWVWIILFSLIGICSSVVVIYWPGIQLPESSHFQLLASKHPFEIYNSKLKNEFWFEKSVTSYENFKFPMRFVWGVQPVDDGDYTNPFSYGNLHYDNNFNISTKAAQVWLLEFCEDLKRQPFYKLTFNFLYPYCFMEKFVTYMEQTCIDSMVETNRTPCCETSKFPYEPHVFDQCLPQSISYLYATRFFIPGVAGPRFLAPKNILKSTFNNNDCIDNTMNFNVNPPIVKAIVIEFESNVSYTTVFHDVQKFVNAVENWFQNQLITAPLELKGGWFISELKFYDVQETLASSTVVAIIVAMSISLIILLFVTLNVLISFYAIITVSLTIFTTVAITILMGWKLNVLESVTVTTAIGLAVDFSLHYGIHYRMSPTSERIAATKFALTRIISPTVMAAITTAIAGSLMLFSNVLPYIQIGLFLIIVMTVSWLYSTFFLMSLLKVAGPQYGFMQFSYPIFRKRPTTNGIKYYDRKQSHIVVTEQLLTPSSSAIGELINSETHELESLTSSSLIKTISGTECLHTLPPEFEHSFQLKSNKFGNVQGGTEKMPLNSTLTANITIELCPTTDTK